MEIRRITVYVAAIPQGNGTTKEREYKTREVAQRALARATRRLARATSFESYTCPACKGCETCTECNPCMDCGQCDTDVTKESKASSKDERPCLPGRCGVLPCPPGSRLHCAASACQLKPFVAADGVELFSTEMQRALNAYVEEYGDPYNEYDAEGYLIRH